LVYIMLFAKSMPVVKRKRELCLRLRIQSPPTFETYDLILCHNVYDASLMDRWLSLGIYYAFCKIYANCEKKKRA